MSSLSVSLLLLLAIGPAISASPSPESPAPVATAVPTRPVAPPGPYGSCAAPITKANVSTLIDPEIPDWMRKEIAVLILEMAERTGCFRGEIASSDKDGRFITNSITALRAYQLQTAGVWHRSDPHTWISPAGDAVPMEESPTPRALLGHWICTNEYGGSRESFYFGPNNQGRSFSGQRTENFIYGYDAPRHDLFLGYGHLEGMAQHIVLGSDTMAMIVWGYFHDDRWTPMPTQPLLACARVK